MFKYNTPISGDQITYYTEKELYDYYIEEGRGPTEALALSQKLVKEIHRMNRREQQMWDRSMKEKILARGEV